LRKNPCIPYERSLEILRGWACKKPKKFLRRVVKAKLDFFCGGVGRGLQPKKPSAGKEWIFSATTQLDYT